MWLRRPNRRGTSLRYAPRLRASWPGASATDVCLTQCDFVAGDVKRPGRAGTPPAACGAAYDAPTFPSRRCSRGRASSRYSAVPTAMYNSNQRTPVLAYHNNASAEPMQASGTG